MKGLRSGHAALFPAQAASLWLCPLLPSYACSSTDFWIYVLQACVFCLKKSRGASIPKPVDPLTLGFKKYVTLKTYSRLVSRL